MLFSKFNNIRRKLRSLLLCNKFCKRRLTSHDRHICASNCCSSVAPHEKTIKRRVTKLCWRLLSTSNSRVEFYLSPNQKGFTFVNVRLSYKKENHQCLVQYGYLLCDEFCNRLLALHDRHICVSRCCSFATPHTKYFAYFNCTIRRIVTLLIAT